MQSTNALKRGTVSRSPSNLTAEHCVRIGFFGEDSEWSDWSRASRENIRGEQAVITTPAHSKKIIKIIGRNSCCGFIGSASRFTSSFIRS
jgi:hypothetical protein